MPPDGGCRPRRRAASRLRTGEPAGEARRPTPDDLARAVRRGATVPDVIAPRLRILFCGINPGRWSGAVGHHFAHPGNRFWKSLHLAGLTTDLLTPADERRLLDAGLGVTNLVPRTTASAADLTADELRAGAEAFARRVRRYAPRTVAVLGLGAYRTAFSRPRAVMGLQAERIGEAAVWVLPNPSGLQATYPLERIVDELRAVADASL